MAHRWQNGNPCPGSWSALPARPRLNPGMTSFMGSRCPAQELPLTPRPPGACRGGKGRLGRPTANTEPGRQARPALTRAIGELGRRVGPAWLCLLGL